VFVAGEVEEGELVALGRVLAFPKFEAEFLVEGDRLLGIGDADASVEKLDHGGE
jgi:hypothetical protein